MEEHAVWTQVGEHRVYTRVWNACGHDLPPVVLIHGFIISGRYLVPLARRLAHGFRVYAPDLPGFGRSTKPPHALDIDGLADALARWMDASGIGRAILVGNSMGCQVLAAFAQRHPSRVLRLVLVGPTTDAHARTVPRQAWRLFLDMLRERRALPFLHVPDSVRMGPRRIFETTRHAMGDGIERRAPDVGAPTLVVRGSRDALVPQGWAEELTRLFPDARLEVVPGSPHAANYSTPDALVRHILPFLMDNATRPGGNAA